MESIEQLIEKAWDNLADKLANDPKFNHPICKPNNERGIVFHFALELMHLFSDLSPEKELTFSFESTIWDEESTDLLIIDHVNGIKGVAFEFKFPQQRGISNSNRTHRRGQIYWDLYRLWRIVTKCNFDSLRIPEAFFLCAVNEEAYVNKANGYSTNPECRTHQDYVIPRLQTLRSVQLGRSKPYDFETPDCHLRFHWKRVGDYWWNTPMRIYVER